MSIQSAAASPEPEEQAQIDESKLRQFLLEAESRQNFGMALIAGTVAAAAGAAIWAAITVSTQYQIGWMAIGVGFLVGIAVRTFGRGITNVYGILGASLALVGCLAGNLMAGCGFVSIHQEISFFAVLAQLDLGIAGRLLGALFSPMDLLFYGLALYEGYHLSFRQIEEDEVAGLVQQPA